MLLKSTRGYPIEIVIECNLENGLTNKTFVVFAGQRVIGEPVASGLALDDSKLWDPDFLTAAK